MLEQIIKEFLSENNYAEFSPKTFFFDMDGVIFDSMPRHAKAWVKVFSDCGITFHEEDVYRNEGRTGRGTIEMVFNDRFGRDATDAEKERIYANKSAYFRTLGEVRIIPNVGRVLNLLHENQQQIFVVTGSGEKTLLGSLDKHFPNIFSADKMVTALDVKKGKPDPEPYLMGLAKSGMQPWEGVVIENAPLGAKSGRASGMFTIAVNTGILDDKELYDAGAHIVLPDMNALYELISTL